MGFLLVVVGSLVLTIAFGYAGSVMGYERSIGEWGGLFLGLLLGPLGLLILLLFPKQRSFGTKHPSGAAPVSSSGGPPPPPRR